MVEDSRNTRVMSRFKDSLLSQLDPSRSLSVHTSDHSSFLQSRLQHLFHSFHTPTHPPYALMIRRAITELNDGNGGSTEEAISEFIRREYDDLPWAHTKILSFHLKKLCQIGELSHTDEDFRYALPVVDGEETKKQCKGSRKRKRNSDQGDEERTGMVDSAGSDELNRVVEEALPSDEFQIQKKSSIDCAQESPKSIISTIGPGIELSSPTQLQPQKSSNDDMGGVSKTTASLTCVNADDDVLPQHYNQGNPEGNLDENPMPRCRKQKIPKGPRGRPRKTKTVANPSEESLFNKQGSIAKSKVKQGRGRPRKGNQDTKQCIEQSQPEDQAKTSVRGRGRGGGRGRGRGGGGGRGRGEGVNQDTEQCEEESHPEDQAKPNGQGGDEGVNQDTEQCEEQSHPEDQAKPNGQGGDECVNQDTEQCEEESHLEDQAKPNGQGGDEGVNQDTEQCEEESHPEDQAKPNGQGGDEGVNQDTEQCEEESHPEDQAKPSVHGRGRGGGRGRGRGGGRGRGRGRGRGEGVNQDTEQCKEESHPEDQAKPNGRGGDRGRGEGVNQDTEQWEEQSHQEDQAKPRGRGRGGGRGRSGSHRQGRPAVRKGLLK